MSNPTQEQVNDGLLIATFLLGQATFGIEASQVQEVSRLGDITPVHQAPNFVVGIRNLRGRIITVIDLRTSLDLGQVQAGPDNRILIVEWHGEPVGLLVDSLADTLTVRADELLPPPPNLHGVQSRNLRGVCRGAGRLVALLELGSLLAEEGQHQAMIKEQVEA